VGDGQGPGHAKGGRDSARAIFYRGVRAYAQSLSRKCIACSLDSRIGFIVALLRPKSRTMSVHTGCLLLLFNIK
jgi:hypothetical protein